MSRSPDSQPPLVLVVDDEPDIATYLMMILEDAGYRVHTAPDAATAMERIREEPPALISLDIMMPRRSGISLYQELQSDPALAPIPAIVVSAFSRLEDFTGPRFRRLVPEGSIPEPAAFVEKPVDVERFLATVRRVLGSEEDEEAGG